MAEQGRGSGNGVHAFNMSWFLLLVCCFRGSWSFKTWYRVLGHCSLFSCTYCTVCIKTHEVSLSTAYKCCTKLRFPCCQGK
ncbi:hypothetical protein B0T19DRAFT_435121 [Cercophora scortea]|uniref:Uncharacterized protein n=1 Tax=Cercophora scortea TaxID=314031 RepID=A0AAE0I2U5_9PEZI|nr:hypothetical protein B0T19DRAFT_435121 [Cercophora scortea]